MYILFYEEIKISNLNKQETYNAQFVSPKIGARDIYDEGEKIREKPNSVTAKLFKPIRHRYIFNRRRIERFTCRWEN